MGRCVVGPDENTDYSQAEKWVATCGVAGGGWRMPIMLELKELYVKGVVTQNLQQIFKITGAFVWGGKGLVVGVDEHPNRATL